MGKLLAAHPARRLALAAAACLALLLGAEAGLRAAKIGAPVWHRPDPVLGWTLRPYAGSHGGSPYGGINAFGQRDNPHDPDRREGVYRIAVLGDERSEALGIRLRETWWHQLPARLDACGFAGKSNIEVLNFGVAGYSTAQESIVLETAVMRFRPDLVVLQISTGKDIRENSRALATRVDRPFYFIDGQGRLRLDASFRRLPDFDRRSQFRYELARAASDHSRVLQLLARASPIDPAHAGIAAAPVPSGPSDTRWQHAWRVTEALIDRMNEFAGRNGARFAMVGAPDRAELEQGARHADTRLAAFGGGHGIPYIALAPKLAPNAHELYDAQGQWTVAGHRAAAQAVAAGLCSSLENAVPSPAPVATANRQHGRPLDEERHRARERHGGGRGGGDTR